MSGAVTHTPAITVVVATHNRAQRLEALLHSLRAQELSERFEVIVVDDASTDSTGAVLARFASEERFDLRTARRIRAGGPASARNEGWVLARAALVAFTDDDCVADSGWLAECLSAARRHPGAVIQGVTRPDPRELDRIGPFSHTRDVDGTGPWFETCNIVYERALLERLGGFDESFPEPLGEDTDLGWRALAAGARHEVAPRALVFHAVEDLGPRSHLKLALRGKDGVLIFKNHPELRRAALRGGVVRNPAHLRLFVAVGGLLVTRSVILRMLLAYPYGRLLMWRLRSVGASPRYATYLVLFDLLTLYTTLRGDLRHRIFII
jgi:glycosyltransferase involved in cell wall biosynthesis